MKKLLFLLLFSIGSLGLIHAQPSQVKAEAKAKAHVCTDACKQNEKCVYLHGEKGHTCGASCKAVGNADLKDHVCTDTCKKNKKCSYSHGEKGHVCGTACKSSKGAKATKASSTKQTASMKDHVCTDACKKNGKCVHAHGEKGHTCDASCKK